MKFARCANFVGGEAQSWADGFHVQRYLEETQVRELHTRMHAAQVEGCSLCSDSGVEECIHVCFPHTLHTPLPSSAARRAHLESYFSNLSSRSDYRGLKKRITAIRRAHQAVSSSSSDEDLIIPPASPRDQPVSFSAPRPSEYASSSTSGPSVRRQSESADTPGHEHDREHHAHWQIRNDREEVESSPERLEGDGNPDSPTRPSLAARSTTVEAAALPRMRRGRSNTVTTVLGRALQRASSTKGTTSGPVAGPRFDVRHPIPLKDLIPQLTPVERAFFEKLDEELDKVESFYCERERDMRHRYAFPLLSTPACLSCVQSEPAQGATARAERPQTSVLRACKSGRTTAPPLLLLTKFVRLGGASGRYSALFLAASSPSYPRGPPHPHAPPETPGR